MRPRTLIYGTCYIGDATMRELVKLWARCADALNPDCDIVIIDAPSPYSPMKFLTPENGMRRAWGLIRECDDKSKIYGWRPGDHPDGNRWIYSFTENAGHLNRGGKDGAGRAFVQGMLLAMEGDYDYCVHNECDLLMTTPIQKWVERMAARGVNAAAPFDSQYQFIEGGLSFFNVNWLRESKFVERYDWQNQTGMPIPEIKIEQLLGDEFFTLPIRGMRNEFGQVTRQHIASGFPYGIDYITHCYKDFEIYRDLMKRNGIEP